MAHAYYVSGEIEKGVEQALAYASEALGLTPASPDLVLLQHGLFSVDDARRLADIAHAAPITGDQKAVIVSLTRFFHEAQNALLKLFEEPPQGVTLILVLPTEGLLLPTLRSRLQPLGHTMSHAIPAIAQEFLSAGEPERAKQLEKLLDRTKADKDEDKQRARNDAVVLLEGLLRAAHTASKKEKRPEARNELRLFIDDLLTFLPLMHTRSAPLKLIFEHLLLVIPKTLGSAEV